MSYALENALFQWREGERRLAARDEPLRTKLDRVAEPIVEALRRRLGSSFLLEELADLYDTDTDWAIALAERAAGTDAASVVDAAFFRYAHEASNYAGGRALTARGRP